MSWRYCACSGMCHTVCPWLPTKSTSSLGIPAFHTVSHKHKHTVSQIIGKLTEFFRTAVSSVCHQNNPFLDFFGKGEEQKILFLHLNIKSTSCNFCQYCVNSIRRGSRHQTDNGSGLFVTHFKISFLIGLVSLFCYALAVAIAADTCPPACCNAAIAACSST